MRALIALVTIFLATSQLAACGGGGGSGTTTTTPATVSGVALPAQVSAVTAK